MSGSGVLGLWRERLQTTVGFVRNLRIRKFLFQLLVYTGSSLGVALAQGLRKLEKNERARHKHRRVFRQVTENFGRLGWLSSAFVNHSGLIQRHGDKFFVLAGADLL